MCLLTYQKLIKRRAKCQWVGSDKIGYYEITMHQWRWTRTAHSWVLRWFIVSHWVDSRGLGRTGKLTINLLVKPLKVFRWWRWRVGVVASLPVSFTKCDISREQTAGLMCDISPRGESQVQIASRLDINGDSSSWPFPHSTIIPSCPLTTGSTEEAEVQWAATGAASFYIHTSPRFFWSSVSSDWLRGAVYNRIIPSRCFPFSCMHQQDEPFTGWSERSVQEWGLAACHLAFLTLFLFHSAAKCPSKLASRQSSRSLNPGANLCYKLWIVIWLLHNLHSSLSLLTSTRFTLSVGNAKCCQLNTVSNKCFD